MEAREQASVYEQAAADHHKPGSRRLSCPPCPSHPAVPHLSVGTEARYVCCAASLSWKAATCRSVGIDVECDKHEHLAASEQAQAWLQAMPARPSVPSPPCSGLRAHRQCASTATHQHPPLTRSRAMESTRSSSLP